MQPPGKAGKFRGNRNDFCANSQAVGHKFFPPEELCRGMKGLRRRLLEPVVTMMQRLAGKN